MAADEATEGFLEAEARACAEGIWETMGPGLEPFRGEDSDFARIPGDVLDAVEADLGRTLTIAEGKAMSTAFSGRMASLLADLVLRANRIRSLLRDPSRRS